jgi:hypothetical protein
MHKVLKQLTHLLILRKKGGKFTRRTVYVVGTRPKQKINKRVKDKRILVLVTSHQPSPKEPRIEPLTPLTWFF